MNTSVGMKAVIMLIALAQKMTLAMHGKVGMKMSDVWKDIPGFEGRYQVSNAGQVRSVPRDVNNHTGVIHLKGKILKQRPDFKGYMRIDLNDNFGRHKYLGVHRLVAMAFIPNPENKPQINHIDGIKNHNFVENLEWVTNQENHDHAVLNGLYPSQHQLREKRRNEKENKETSKGMPGKKPKTVLQIDPISKEIIGKYQSIADAARAVGCKSPSNIGECCRSAYGRKTICGYEWKFREGVVV